MLFVALTCKLAVVPLSPIWMLEGFETGFLGSFSCNMLIICAISFLSSVSVYFQLYRRCLFYKLVIELIVLC